MPIPFTFSQAIFYSSTEIQQFGLNFCGVSQPPWSGLVLASLQKGNYGIIKRCHCSNRFTFHTRKVIVLHLLTSLIDSDEMNVVWLSRNRGFDPFLFIHCWWEFKYLVLCLSNTLLINECGMGF